MSDTDKTKKVLQDALDALFKQQSSAVGGPFRGSYLLAQDGQFLGTITKNRYDPLSLLNRYGPHGSRYSSTSIFNKYSPYGGRYGAYSVNNPNCANPPKLIIKDRFAGFVTGNSRIKDRIDPEVFTSLLDSDVDALLRGDFQSTVPDLGYASGELYIKAADGTFLGSLSTNGYDAQSIFNQYGLHGSPYSVASIFNQYGRFGGEFSSYSPYNQFTSQPPVIMRGDQVVAYLTKNRFLTPRVDPDMIEAFAQKNA